MLQEVYVNRSKKYVRFYDLDSKRYKWISDNIDDPSNSSNMYTITFDADGHKGKIIFPKDRVIVTVIE